MMLVLGAVLVQRQIGSQHHRRPLKRLFQGSRHWTTARGEESV